MVQAELYAALKQVGFKPILEQSLELQHQNIHGRWMKIRVDVLLTDPDSNALGVIEVKTDRYNIGPRKPRGGKQLEKYRLLGLPYTYCTSMAEIPGTVAWAKQLCA